MNSINITGRLTADPELKKTQSGVSVCSYTLAVKRPKVKDVTDFINCVSWRQGAEYLTMYGRKGNMVAVAGVMTSRKWQDNNGNNRVTFEVIADTVELVGGNQEGQKQHQTATNGQTTQGGFLEVDDMDGEDLPF